MTASGKSVLCCIAFILCGCGYEQSDYGQFVQVVRQSFDQSFSKRRITLQQAAAIPYASMGWRLNDSSENLIVLATDNGSRQLWTSAAHIVLVTQDGRIVRTVGLPTDLVNETAQNAPALSTPSRALKGAYTESRVSDFSGQFGVTTICNAHYTGARMVTILGKKIRTLRIDEDCRRGDWRFTDTYWLDPDTGMAWQTIQHLTAKAVVQTNILRPPG